MALLTNLKHYNDIIWLLYKYGQKDLLTNFSSQLDLPQVLKEKGNDRGKAEDLVKDLESLGPFYVKLGQILGSEVQLLPPEYDEALQKLQDQATPMPYSDVESIIQAELGDSPQKIFKTFNKKPISAASLGQVHFAELPSKKKVAVKIQRKNIRETILEQLEALGQISSFLEENTEFGKKYQILEKFQNLKMILLNELDYIKEADNLNIIHNNLKDFEHLIVPLPIAEYTTSKVLTMEFIKGERIEELNPVKQIAVDGPLLAKELFQGFLKQILFDGFFQMDPHPGNVYLTHLDKNPHLALMDMGMVAQVPFQMQGQFIQCMLALSDNRELEVTKILISLGRKSSDFDEYLFRNKISELMASSRGRTISQIPMGKIMLKLSSVAAEQGLWLPIQFSTVGKTLLSLSPVLRSLDPDFDPNQLLKEIAPELINKRVSQQFTTRSLYGSVLEGMEFLQRLPSRLDELFDLLMKSDYQLKVRFLESGAIANNFEKIANRITTGLILAALVISASLLMQVDTPFKLFGYPGFAMLLFLMAATGGIALILAILWNDRKKGQ